MIVETEQVHASARSSYFLSVKPYEDIIAAYEDGNKILIHMNDTDMTALNDNYHIDAYVPLYYITKFGDGNEYGYECIMDVFDIGEITVSYESGKMKFMRVKSE